MAKFTIDLPSYEVVDERLFLEYFRWGEIDRKSITSRHPPFLDALAYSVSLGNEGGGPQKSKDKIISAVNKGKKVDLKFVVTGKTPETNANSAGDKINSIETFINILLSQRREHQIKRKHILLINDVVYVNNNHLISIVKGDENHPGLEVVVRKSYEKKASFRSPKIKEGLDLLTIYDDHDYSLVTPDNALWYVYSKDFLSRGNNLYDQMKLDILIATVDNLGIEFPELKEAANWNCQEAGKTVKKTAKLRNQQLKDAKQELAQIICSPEAYAFSYDDNIFKSQLEPRPRINFNKVYESFMGDEENPGLLFKIRAAELAGESLEHVRLRKAPSGNKEAYVPLSYLKKIIQDLKDENCTYYVEQNLFRL